MLNLLAVLCARYEAMVGRGLLNKKGCWEGACGEKIWKGFGFGICIYLNTGGHLGRERLQIERADTGFAYSFCCVFGNMAGCTE